MQGRISNKMEKEIRREKQSGWLLVYLLWRFTLYDWLGLVWFGFMVDQPLNII